MTCKNRVLIPAGGLLTCLAALFLFSGTALAADADWRPTYDIVMKWVNFVILAALLVKLLKTPLMDFLKNQREATAREIETAETEKKQTEEKIIETRKLIEEGESRLEEIRDRIVRQGELQKAKIVEEATQQSRIMMSEAQRRIDSQMIRAKARIRAELVDAAVAGALERLPGVIDEKDNARLLERFIAGAKVV